MAGWLSIERKLFDHWIWKSNEPFDKRSAWIDLIGMASYADHTGKTYDGKIDVIKRGEIHTSMLYLADRWKWDRRKVKRFLSVLQMEGMLHFGSTTDGTRGGTVITLENYGFYQSKRTADGTTDGMYHGTTDGTTGAHIITKETKKQSYLSNNNRAAGSEIRDKSFYGIPEDQAWTVEEKMAALRERWK